MQSSSCQYSVSCVFKSKFQDHSGSPDCPVSLDYNSYSIAFDYSRTGSKDKTETVLAPIFLLCILFEIQSVCLFGTCISIIVNIESDLEDSKTSYIRSSIIPIPPILCILNGKLKRSSIRLINTPKSIYLLHLPASADTDL